MLDHIDLEILELLKENSKIQCKDIGQKIHMTGQAVGNRIRRLEDSGVIERYTIGLNRAKLLQPITAFITVFVTTENHAAFHDFYQIEEVISEVHRTSGDGCYLLTAHFGSNEELEIFLSHLLKYGNYRVNLSLGKKK